MQAERGDPGSTGATGPRGQQGSAGPRGLSGDTGFPGPGGQPGRKGSAGLEGGRGLPGPTGFTGDAGDTGVIGQPGPIGQPGQRGDEGAPGFTGKHLHFLLLWLLCFNCILSFYSSEVMERNSTERYHVFSSEPDLKTYICNLGFSSLKWWAQKLPVFGDFMTTSQLKHKSLQNETCYGQQKIFSNY